MKSRLFILSVMFLLMLGCTKDNSTGGGPVIGIKSYNSAVYNDGNGFNFVLTFSQKGGSPSGDSLTIIEHRLNLSNDVPSPIDTLGTRLPIVPSVDKAEFTTNLQWQFIQFGIQGENDTCFFQFVLVDLNQKHSDTVATGTVIIYQF
jgi:hypothetical protein